MYGIYRDMVGRYLHPRFGDGMVLLAAAQLMANNKTEELRKQKEASTITRGGDSICDEREEKETQSGA
jgi:hypothetical protein